MSSPAPEIHKNRAHIYVSIYHDNAGAASSSTKSKHHRWAVLVEPREQHLLSIHTTGREPLLFFNSVESRTSSWACHTRSPDEVEKLIGKVLVAEGRLTSTVGVEELLRARFVSETEVGDEGEGGPVRHSEQWIRGAVRALQGEGLVEAWDVDDFMVFARGYVKERVLGRGELGDLAPEVVDYSARRAGGEDGNPKKTGRRRWLSVGRDGDSSKSRSREGTPNGDS